MQALRNHEEVEVKVTVNTTFVVTAPMVGLKADDLRHYLNHHAEKAVGNALTDLALGIKTPQELGFS